MNILQLINWHHHHHNIKQRMYTSKNHRNQKPQSLNIRVTIELKWIMTLKYASLIPKKLNIILPKDSLSIFVVVLYIWTQISLQSQWLKLFFDEMWAYKPHTKTKKRKNRNSNIPHGTMNNLNSSHIFKNQDLAYYQPHIKIEKIKMTIAKLIIHQRGRRKRKENSNNTAQINLHHSSF